MALLGPGPGPEPPVGSAETAASPLSALPLHLWPAAQLATASTVPAVDAAQLG